MRTSKQTYSYNLLLSIATKAINEGIPLDVIRDKWFKGKYQEYLQFYAIYINLKNIKDRQVILISLINKGYKFIKEGINQMKQMLNSIEALQRARDSMKADLKNLEGTNLVIEPINNSNTNSKVSLNEFLKDNIDLVQSRIDYNIANAELYMNDLNNLKVAVDRVQVRVDDLSALSLLSILNII